MANVNPYLTFNGTCEAAFDFYQSVFGGEFPYKGKYKDMPPGEYPLPDAEKEKIMHICLPIGGGSMLMGSDSSEAFGKATTMGDNIAISINTDSEEEATRLFNGLSAGGKITMPLDKTFWGAFFGMFVDKFGIHWMVNYDYEQAE
ncbi:MULTISPECIES: VOC family protein [Flavobacterium]|uniref:VOC family protein n=1 Tax=Flavobacterium TaxID=237 RepID=UPI000969E966|nr:MULTISPECIES: VOC family protein [Flavobacterium]MBN9285740.1 VOC family protein [Flavobacterium sp.]OJV70634.1 MAG: VOC family protein [Flavobacterium sp. 40-81]